MMAPGVRGLVQWARRWKRLAKRLRQSAIEGARAAKVWRAATEDWHKLADERSAEIVRLMDERDQLGYLAAFLKANKLTACSEAEHVVLEKMAALEMPEIRALYTLGISFPRVAEALEAENQRRKHRTQEEGKS